MSNLPPAQSSLQWFAVTARYALVAAFIVIHGIVLVGVSLIDAIESHELLSSARTSTSYVASVIGPLVTEAETPLSPDVISTIDARLASSWMGRQLFAIKILSPDGSIAYSSNKSEIGMKPALANELRNAFAGYLQVDLKSPHPDKNSKDQRPALPVRSVSLPLHDFTNNRIFAVAQYYEYDEPLLAELSRPRRWIIGFLAVFTIGTIGSLFVIIYRSNHAIHAQQIALEQRLDAELRLNTQNAKLRRKLYEANRRGLEINERFLRRIGSDLHDGPAQHLALVLLRLDELMPLLNERKKNGAVSPPEAFQTIHRATADALLEIRNLSSGLVLPELHRASLAEGIAVAVRTHERATGTHVETDIKSLPLRLPQSWTVCLYRVAQEGLNNAFQHGGAKGQRLRASCDDKGIELEITDTGPGFAVESLPLDTNHLGLIGLRHRVESLGGVLTVHSKLGVGTRLTVRFNKDFAAGHQELESAYAGRSPLDPSSEQAIDDAQGSLMR